jgi:(2Fe-2S) ferredoxin
MPDVGLVFACSGCCCGHPERGGPKPAPRTLKMAARRAYRASDVVGSLRLSFTDCLGPCSEANVVFPYLRGRPLWFRRMNSPELPTDLVVDARGALHNHDPGLPESLAVRSFSWAGGGIRPEAPVEELA